MPEMFRGLRSLRAPGPRDPTETEPDLPLSIGVSAVEAGVSIYATGEEWRNNSRKSEGLEPKQKQYSVVDVTGDGGKV